jgi:hypothetical protein
MNVAHRTSLALVSMLLLPFTTGCTDAPVLGPAATGEVRVTEIDGAGAPGLQQARVRASISDQACWGQASRVFAQMGEMGEHSSSYPTPRLGLRNLARMLYDMGVIEEDTMQALGAYVASELGLRIDACL